MSDVRKLTAAEYADLPWMHIYPQHSAHSPAEIKGTRTALIALRDAIDRALADKNGESEAEAIAADGEGYDVQIRRVPRSFLQRTRLPYSWYDLARR